MVATPERIESLPRWAQRRIATLEMNLRERNAEWQRVQEGDSRISWHYFIDQVELIPDNATVRFQLGEKAEISVRLDEDTDGSTRLWVHGLDGHIVVTPDSSNSIRLSIDTFLMRQERLEAARASKAS